MSCSMFPDLCCVYNNSIRRPHSKYSPAYSSLATVLFSPKIILLRINDNFLSLSQSASSIAVIAKYSDPCSKNNGINNSSSSAS